MVAQTVSLRCWQENSSAATTQIVSLRRASEDLVEKTAQP
jgi:hypothetical protein